MNQIFFRSLSVLTLFLTVSACAKPTYVSTAQPPTQKDGEKDGDKDEVTCAARFQKSGYCITLDWDPKPTDSAVGSFIFKVYRPNEADESPLPIDVVGAMNVRLFMPSMGHGSSPISVEHVDTGTYRASNVFFSMHGDWQIIFELKQKSGPLIDNATMPFNY